MMINNNPYNLPERPPNKPNRIYTQLTINQHRSENVDPPIPYAQYLVRHTSSQPTNNSQHNSQHQYMAKPSLDEGNNYRTSFAPMRNDIKHLLSSPKNQNSSLNNLTNFLGSGTQGRSNTGSSVDKKNIEGLRDGVNNHQLSLNPPQPLSLTQLNDRIQNLTNSLKFNQKRISELQKNASSGFLPNNSKLNFSEPDNVGGEILMKFQNDWMDNFHRIQQDVQTVKEELKKNRQIGVLDKIVTQRCKQIFESSKISQSTLTSTSRHGNDEIKKELENMKIQIQQRLKKKYQILTGVINKVEKDLHTCNQSLYTLSTVVSLSNSPIFKPSTIKCSTTAILLRFIECFKVRKHGSKSGQIKITLADTTYYIDNQGYLLDKEQYYLVDGRDCRIKLEDQHLRLLKQQGILI